MENSAPSAEGSQTRLSCLCLPAVVMHPRIAPHLPSPNGTWSQENCHRGGDVCQYLRAVPIVATVSMRSRRAYGQANIHNRTIVQKEQRCLSFSGVSLLSFPQLCDSTALYANHIVIRPLSSIMSWRATSRKGRVVFDWPTS